MKTKLSQFSNSFRNSIKNFVEGFQVIRIDVIKTLTRKLSGAVRKNSDKSEKSENFYTIITDLLE